MKPVSTPRRFSSSFRRLYGSCSRAASELTWTSTRRSSLGTSLRRFFSVATGISCSRASGRAATCDHCRVVRCFGIPAATPGLACFSGCKMCMAPAGGAAAIAWAVIEVAGIPSARGDSGGVTSVPTVALLKSVLTMCCSTAALSCNAHARYSAISSVDKDSTSCATRSLYFWQTIRRTVRARWASVIALLMAPVVLEGGCQAAGSF